MAKKISIFKKIGLFRSFKKSIKESKSELENRFQARIDIASRIYTVLNIPENLIGEAYSLKKSDIDKISENYIISYSSEISKFLDSKGLKELYKTYDVKKVDKYSYLIVIGFSLFKSEKFYNNIYYKLLPTISILLIILFILLYN